MYSFTGFHFETSIVVNFRNVKVLLFWIFNSRILFLIYLISLLALVNILRGKKQKTRKLHLCCHFEMVRLMK